MWRGTLWNQMRDPVPMSASGSVSDRVAFVVYGAMYLMY